MYFDAVFKLIVTFFLLFSVAPAGEPITPLPSSLPVDAPKAALGKALFFDPILSKDGSVACVNCHDLQNGGDDNLRFSFGINGQEGAINAPTVFNAVFNFRQFWNGRAKDLAAQAQGPIENPIEMGHTFAALVPILQASPYAERFAALYAEGITRETIADAIAEYEKQLITPDAPLDRYLRGKRDAMSADQIEGYALFRSKGCIVCHHGVNVGGNLYSKFGVIVDANSTDPGRFAVTGRESDRFLFKVPSLRNIAETAPYFHDGRTYSLIEAVKIMALHQLGRTLTPDELQKIVRFLHALTGEVPVAAR